MNWLRFALAAAGIAAGAAAVAASIVKKKMTARWMII